MNRTQRKKSLRLRLLMGLLLTALLAGMAITPLSVTPAAAQGSAADAKMAVVGLDGATLEDAPGGKSVAELAPGDVLTALGRTEDGEYLQVQTERGADGWVAISSVVIFGINTLPVVNAPQPATPTPAPTPTRQPTATPEAKPSPTPSAEATATEPAAEEAAAETEPTATGEPESAGVEDMIGVVVGTGADLYDAPDGESVQTLPGAEAVTISGRDANGDWLKVTTLAGDAGWMQAADLVVFGVDELPVMIGQESIEKPAASAAITSTGSVTMTATVGNIKLPTPAATEEAENASADAPASIELPAAVMTGTVNVSGARLNIRAGAGSTAPIIGKAAGGETLDVAARSEDSSWLLVLREDLPEGAGWVSASLVRLSDAVNDLPVSELESAPASAAPATAVPARPASTATPAPAAKPTEPASEETAPAAAPTNEPAETPVSATTAAPAVSRTSATGLSGTLVFQDGRGGIYAYDLDRGEVRTLTSGFDPAISRDGSKVAYLGGDGIRSINIDGSGDRLVFASSDLITSPKWSPDGERIVFSRIIGEYKCWQTEFMGCLTLRELRQRFPFIPPAVLQQMFLNDYERVAFPNFGLTRVNAQGEEFRDIAALDSAQAPDWNEDGIVYQSKAGIEITQDKPDGETRSVQWGDWDWDPDWAPNGGPIVYQSKEGPHWEIFRINPDGSGVVALTRPATTLVDEMPSNVAPTFSPDGQHVVFLSNRQDDNEAGAWRLWVMNADGSNQRLLPLDIEIDYGFGGEQVASWGS